MTKREQDAKDRQQGRKIRKARRTGGVYRSVPSKPSLKAQ